MPSSSCASARLIHTVMSSLLPRSGLTLATVNSRPMSLVLSPALSARLRASSCPRIIVPGATGSSSGFCCLLWMYTSPRTPISSTVRSRSGHFTFCCKDGSTWLMVATRLLARRVAYSSGMYFEAKSSA